MQVYVSAVTKIEYGQAISEDKKILINNIFDKVEIYGSNRPKKKHTMYSTSIWNCCLYEELKYKQHINNRRRKIDEKCQQITMAIEIRDADALKELFSETALNETSNFSEGCNYLFSEHHGTVDSIKNDDSADAYRHFITHRKFLKSFYYNQGSVYTCSLTNSFPRLFFVYSIAVYIIIFHISELIIKHRCCL